MTRATLLPAAIAWLAILVLAVLNGALREKLLLPRLGAPRARRASGLLLCGLVLGVAAGFSAWRPGLSDGQLFAVGGGWLAATLAFEFGFGRLLLRKPWPEILDAYRFKDGQLWPLVLAVVSCAPWLAGRVTAAG